ncbi:phospholipase effector Tle1 domain-containing protein [Apibacter muscae]|nr:DUF2235 domain-containing protein [Apibacter muscae]
MYLGFSRGAAAARNFLYEVNVKPAYPAQKQQQVMEESNNYARVITDFKDSDEKLIDESLLENNILPARGHLGYKLLESKKFTQEELENLTLIIIRFLGVYDTVSSYEEAGDGDAPVMYTGMKRLAVNIFNDVEELQLNNLGPIKKAVHFTAMDEHRENFSLTRLSIHGAIEKAFHGVHSDISGSYDSGVEIINEVETSNNISEKELITFREKLIDHYWWNNKELLLQREHKLLGKIFKYSKHLIPGGATTYDYINYYKLIGTRTLKKEYSYIPLHFMNQYYGNILAKDKQKEKIFIRDITQVYSIANHSHLVRVKQILRNYVVSYTNTKKWEFITDEELKAEHEKLIKKKLEEANKKYLDDLLKKRIEQQTKQPQKTLEQKMREMELERTRQRSDNTRIDGYNERAGLEHKKKKIDDVLNGKPTEGAIRKANPWVLSNEQKNLRILRHQYLHWSAIRDWIGMDPVTSREITVY